MAKKKDVTVVIATLAKKLIEEKGEKYTNWKKETLDRAKLAVMAGEDKEWENHVLDEAHQTMVIEHLLLQEESVQENSSSDQIHNNY